MPFLFIYDSGSFYAASKARAGVNSIEVDASKLGQIIQYFQEVNPKLGEVITTSSFIVDGTSIENLNFKISQNSVVEVLPQFAGG